MKKLSRREMIKRTGSWALLAPVLMSRSVQAMADTPDGPRRIIVLFSPNGPILEEGPAIGPETGFQVHDWWGPLERHRQDGFFFSNLYQAGVQFGENDVLGHQAAGTGALTARTTEKTNNATGPSIDQYIGQTLQEEGILTPHRSVLWGMHNNTSNWGPWYEGPGKPLAPTHNPYDALEQLLPYLSSNNEGELARIRDLKRRHFILDNAYRDCRALRGKLDATGKEVLDFHCHNIETLEQSVITALANDNSMCFAPEAPSTSLPRDTNFNQRSTRDEALNAFIDMTALSFACDLTRVVGFSFGGSAARFGIPDSYAIPSSAEVDSGDSGPQHHAWTHAQDAEPRREALGGFTTWYSEAVAKFIDKLKATPDADGKPLMDSTLVFWTSELGAQGSWNAHPLDNIPVLMFGNSLGKFKTNRHFAAPDGDEASRTLPLHALMVSMIRHMGLDSIDTFGNAGVGPLDWLEG